MQRRGGAVKLRRRTVVDDERLLAAPLLHDLGVLIVRHSLVHAVILIELWAQAGRQCQKASKWMETAVSVV